MGGVARLLHELLPELRRERGLSQPQLAHKTGGPDDYGVSVGTIQGYEKPSRAGVVPEVEILDALGRALGVDPAATFYEYPLAEARRRARPGVSLRRSATPGDELVEELEDAAQQRDPQRTPSAPAAPSTRRSRRAS